MKNNRNFYALNLILTTILSLTFGLTARAQSTDIDSPTALTSNVIEGEGDGKAETFYYSFTATKGDVKVTLDAKTDYYSVIMDVSLTDEDGKELLKISAVATDTGKREVATKHFVRDTKVILRVRLPKAENLKLLTYKIKLDGAVKVETSPATVETTPTAGQTNTTQTSEQPANSTAPTADSPTTTADSPATADGEKKKTNSKLKDKLKKKVKDATKKTVKDIVDN
ncbi:MAG: hypothetical protein ACR2MG_02930 [Pyrinomonadaceae bacterium]